MLVDAVAEQALLSVAELNEIEVEIVVELSKVKDRMIAPLEMTDDNATVELSALAERFVVTLLVVDVEDDIIFEPSDVEGGTVVVLGPPEADEERLVPTPRIDEDVDALVAGNEGDSTIDEDANSIVDDVAGAASVIDG